MRDELVAYCLEVMADDNIKRVASAQTYLPHLRIGSEVDRFCVKHESTASFRWYSAMSHA